MIRPSASYAARDQLAQLAEKLAEGVVAPKRGDEIRRRIRAGEIVFEPTPSKYAGRGGPPKRAPAPLKLTIEAARHIRQLYEDGKPKAEIAADYGITPNYVHNIVTYRVWPDAQR